MSESNPDRLRRPPRERFTGESQNYDLEQVFQELADESYPAIDGHHQIALFKGGASTVLAFLFETDGYLPRHQANGIATIQVVEGRLSVETPTGEHVVGQGGLLVLRPCVPHDVRAEEPTKMILTVHLQESERKPGD